MTEVRGQRSDDRRQMSDDGKQMTDDGKQMTEHKWQHSEISICPLSSDFCSLSSELVEPLFFDPGGLASELAQVINFGASYTAAGYDLDFVNNR